MRIAVIGAGAMGSLFGGLLATHPDNDVWLIDPWIDHITTIKEEGLTLITPDGETLVLRVNATTDPEEVRGQAGLADMALICVKSYATTRAARQAARILAPDGLVLTLQNGLGNREAIAEVVGETRVVQGVTSHGASVLGPGRIRHAGTGETYLTPPTPNMRPRVEAIADVFAHVGIETRVIDDLQTLLWSKLIVNVGINALTAILRVHNGVLTRYDICRDMVARAVNEAVAVAHALGIELPYDEPVRHVLDVAWRTGANRSSMLTDILRGTPTEIDAINGVVVREGERLGIPTPFNEALVLLVKGLEATTEERIEETLPYKPTIP